MEDNPVNVPNGSETHTTPVGRANQLVEASAAEDPAASSRFYTDLAVASSDSKRQSYAVNQHSSVAHQSSGAGVGVETQTFPTGVSNCYVFKSRLQEYAQKVGLPTPVYETIKEGPSHEPSFRSTVIVDGIRYDSLPGFFNRKAAEQSAAEIALMELSKCGENNETITAPVHETGLCKNLLQEYAQKMNYAIPTYICHKDDKPGRTPLFSCTVEIGGIQYIGAAATTKKEAELRAARTALLAIRSSSSDESEDLVSKARYTVVPGKRKAPETTTPKVETVKPKKQKRPRFKKPRKFRHRNDVGDEIQIQAGSKGVLIDNDMNTQVAVQQFQRSFSDVGVPNYGLTTHSLASSAQDNSRLKINRSNGEVTTDGALAFEVGACPDSSQSTASSVQQLGGVGNRDRSC